MNNNNNSKKNHNNVVIVLCWVVAEIQLVNVLWGCIKIGVKCRWLDSLRGSNALLHYLLPEQRDNDTVIQYTIRSLRNSQPFPSVIARKSSTNLSYLTVWKTLHSQLNNWIFLLTVALWCCTVCFCCNVSCTIQHWAAINHSFIRLCTGCCWSYADVIARRREFTTNCMFKDICCRNVICVFYLGVYIFT